MAERHDTGMETLWFVAGALVGAGVALLLAPKSGREIRGSMSDFTTDALARMKEYGADAQEKMRSAYYRGKEMAQEKARGMSSPTETGETTVH